MLSLQKLPLRTKLVFSVAAIVLLGFVITIGALSLQARSLQQRSALSYTEELAKRHGTEVQNVLNEAMNTAHVLADSLTSMRSQGAIDRAAADTLMKGVLAGNPRLLGVWSGWEPNAFDGQDTKYAGQAGHDATGRYIPYWNRGSGTIQVEPLVDYEKPGAGDYYLLPKQTGNEVLIEPYVYPVAGKDTLITSLVVPIKQDGKFVGVAGVDIALASLQDTISNIRVMDAGHASLVSNTGIYVSNKDASLVGKTMPKSEPFEAALKSIQAGNSHQVRLSDPDMGDTTQIYVPVKVGQVTTPWGFVAAVPDHKIYEEVTRLTWTALALCVVSILVVSSVLSYAVNRMILRPIGGDPADAAAMANRVAQGDLSQQIHVAAGDKESLMAQLKLMQDSLAHVVSDVRRNAENVARASAEISQGNQDLSMRTESQASAIEETVASMEELGSTVNQNADSAQAANDHALNAAQVATQGGELMVKVVETMDDISNSSQRIADIIGVIDGIAFQTNILALNAAVEAARAGEQGRGFAVVAGEVRSLAQRSAEAAKEIKQLINASVDRVTLGSQLVDQAGTTMQQVVQAIQSVNDVMAGISAASREQSLGVSQIGEAMGNLDRTTQQNAAMVEEMAVAGNALKTQAEELVQAVAVFRF